MTTKSRFQTGLAALLATATAAATLGACGATTAISTPHAVLSTPGSSNPVAAAKADDDARLHTLAGLTGWQLASAPPAGLPSDLGVPSYPIQTTDFVVVSRYVTLSGTDPGTALQQAGKLPGAGNSGLSIAGSSSGGLDMAEQLFFNAVTGLPVRNLDVAAMDSGDYTYVRLDAVDFYDPAKPADEEIPAGVVRVRLVLTPTVDGPARTFEITEPAEILQLVNAVSSLQRTYDYVGTEPRTPPSESFVASFFERASTTPVVTVVENNPQLGGSDTFTLRGRPLPRVQDFSRRLAKTVESLTGVTFTT